MQLQAYEWPKLIFELIVIVGRHRSINCNNCSFCDKSTTIGRCVDTLGTKLDIGTSQTHTLVAVEALFQNVCQQFIKMSYPIGPTCNNVHNLDPSKPENQMNTCIYFHNQH